MATILYDEKRKKEYQRTEKELLKKIPLVYRRKCKKLLQAELEGDGKKQIALGEEMMAEGCQEAFILLSVARGYLQLDKPQSALTILSQIKESDPIIVQHKALCYQIQEKHDKVIKLMEAIFPPDDYEPFFYTTYAFSARKMGDAALAYELYEVVKEKYVKENYHPGAYLLDGVFQNLLELDMLYYPEQLDRHLKEYKSFLAESEMDEQEQHNLASSLIMFCSYLGEEAYQKPFQELLDFIHSKRLFTLRYAQNVWYTSYTILEFGQMNEDGKISDFLKNLLGAYVEALKEQHLSVYENADGFEILETPRQKDYEEIQKQQLLLKYCSGKRWPGLAEEFLHLEMTYPYNYVLIRELAEQMRTDWKETTENAFLELCRLEQVTSGEQADFRHFIENHYRELYESGTLVWDSYEQETYRREEKKIGRNDPCPCGSGKKYKHCCGRTA